MDVIVVGAGFGGLSVARGLRGSGARVTVIDRTNHHLFQPLLYQVATAALPSSSVAVPIRGVLNKSVDTEVLLGEVTNVDLDAREVVLDHTDVVPYDRLVIAVGTRTKYFGPPHWAESSLGLKSLEEAEEMRRRVLVAFEAAERERDPSVRRALLTFVVVGGGPTGVEVAGALAELGKMVLTRDFRRIFPADIRVVLVEAAPRLLMPFHEELSERARRDLVELGVEVRVHEPVQDITLSHVTVGGEVIPTRTVVWAAGVKPDDLVHKLGVPLDKGGRIVVGPDCAVPGRPELFAIGDAAAFTQGESVLPALAPVAKQQGKFVAKAIRCDLEDRPRGKFHYADKGIMATVGRNRAVAQVGSWKLGGWFAWVAWLLVHVAYLVGFKNRIAVLFEWAWAYVTFRRGSRLITGSRELPRPVVREAARAAAPPS